MKMLQALVVLAAGWMLSPVVANGQDAKTAQPEKPLRASTTPASPQAASGTPSSTPTSQAERSGGEKAFEANCSRCHQAPEQIAPRITGTVLMHMRVRASLSKADEKALLEFLAP